MSSSNSHSKNGIIIFFFLFTNLYVLTTSQVYSQQSKIDSLDRVLTKAISEKKGVKVIQDIVWKQLDLAQYISFNLHLKYAVKGLEIADRLDDKIFVAGMYHEIGKAYKQMGHYDLAIQNYNKVVDRYYESGMYDAVIYSYIGIGNIYYSRKLYEIARDIYQKGIELGKAHIIDGNAIKNAMSVCYNNLGLCEREIGNYDLAMDYFRRGLDIRKGINAYYLIPHSLNYMAHIEQLKGNLSKSIEIYSEAIATNKNNILLMNANKVKYTQNIFYDMNEFMLDSYFGLIRDYHELNLVDSVKANQLRAESLIQNGNYVKLLNLNKLLLSYYKKNNLSDSVRTISQRIMSIADSIGAIEQKSNMAKELMEYYANKGDAKSAFKYLEVYNIMLDSLQKNKFDVVSYNFQKSEAIKNSKSTIAEIEAQKKKEIQFQYLIRNITLIILVFMIIAGVFFYKRYKLKNDLISFLDSVINSLTYPFYVINIENMIIEHINQKGNELGLSNNNNNFRKGNFTVYEINDDDINRIYKVVSSLESLITDKQIIDVDGATKYLRVFNYPILEGNLKISNVIEYVVDITLNKNNDIEREKLIDELKLTNTALADETNKVTSLNTNLTESEEHLKILNSTKDKFFSIIAHDLKNPIGNYINLTKLLVDDYFDFTEFERLDILEMMKNSSEQLYS